MSQEALESGVAQETVEKQDSGEQQGDEAKTYPKEITGHYEIDETGLVKIKEEHIYQDIKTVMDGDYKTFLKVFDVNKEKGDVIAQSLGTKGDGIRSAGKVLYDALDAYVNAETDERKTEIKEKFFAPALRGEGTNFSWGDHQGNVEPEIKQAAEVNFDGIIEDKVSRSLYKFVDRSMSEQEVQVIKEQLIKKVQSDAKFKDFVSTDKFDINTGQKLSNEQKVSLFLSQNPLSTDNSGAEYKTPSPTNVVTPKVDSGLAKREAAKERAMKMAQKMFKK